MGRPWLAVASERLTTEYDSLMYPYMSLGVIARGNHQNISFYRQSQCRWPDCDPDPYLNCF